MSGIKGMKQTQASRNKRSEALIKLWATPEYRAKMNKIQKKSGWRNYPVT